jgi:hypothetical protein
MEIELSTSFLSFSYRVIGQIKVMKAGWPLFTVKLRVLSVKITLPAQQQHRNVI